METTFTNNEEPSNDSKLTTNFNIEADNQGKYVSCKYFVIHQLPLPIYNALLKLSVFAEIGLFAFITLCTLTIVSQSHQQQQQSTNQPTPASFQGESFENLSGSIRVTQTLMTASNICDKIGNNKGIVWQIFKLSINENILVTNSKSRIQI